MGGLLGGLLGGFLGRWPLDGTLLDGTLGEWNASRWNALLSGKAPRQSLVMRRRGGAVVLCHERDTTKGTPAGWGTRVSRIDVLVIDDWAMAPLSEPERRDFWEICEDRYQVRYHPHVATASLSLARANR